MNQKEYWTQRYLDNSTSWNLGYPSTPIKTYIDQINNKDLKILIPGAGNGYEAEYLYELDFPNVYIADISHIPLKNLKERVPNYPDDKLINDNFFNLKGQYDLIIEQTFFCAINPNLRIEYVNQVRALLKPCLLYTSPSPRD